MTEHIDPRETGKSTSQQFLDFVRASAGKLQWDKMAEWEKQFLSQYLINKPRSATTKDGAPKMSVPK
jgi:hypothetical protein